MIVSRLTPHQDLKIGIEDIFRKSTLNSGIIICIVGSLNQAVLRMSDSKSKALAGPLEIVSTEGTLSQDGLHVHLAVSDEEGTVFGGHLLPGCTVYTTAEICILESDKKLRRVYDSETGYRELHIMDDTPDVHSD